MTYTTYSYKICHYECCRTRFANNTKIMTYYNIAGILCTSCIIYIRMLLYYCVLLCSSVDRHDGISPKRMIQIYVMNYDKNIMLL